MKDMDEKKYVLNEIGMDIAKEKNAMEFAELTKKYKETKDKATKDRLIELLLDRDEIYKGNLDVIKKYM